MKKVTVSPGQDFAGGRVIRVLLSDVHGHQRVTFACAFCRTYAICRMSDLRSGRQGSCGCRKNSEYLRHLARLAQSVPKELQHEVWDFGEIHGLKATFKKYRTSLRRLGIEARHQQALLNFVWRTHGARMVSALKKSTRDLLYAAMQRRGLQYTATEYRMSPSLVLRVVRVARKQRMAGLKLRLSLSAAIELAGAGRAVLEEAQANEYQGEWYRPRGELSKRELTGISRAGKSSLRAAFELLRRVPLVEISHRHRASVSAFIEACERTLRRRKARSDKSNSDRHREVRTICFPVPGNEL